MARSSEPRMNSLFRIQTMISLMENKMSGYDLAKRLKEVTGKKPSTGKIYPFLNQLLENGYISETETDDDSERDKKVYELTEKGEDLVNDLLERMDNILNARLDQLLDSCKNCGVKLFESKITGIDENHKEATFCCKHCRTVYYENYNIDHE